MPLVRSHLPKLRRKTISLCALTFFIVLPSFLFFNTSSAKKTVTYLTTHGSGPDKWASVWLLERSGVGNIRIVDTEQDTDVGGIWFDIPGAVLNRTASSTTLDVLLDSLKINSESVKLLAEIIHDIEIGAWRAERSVESEVVELAFRGLQARYGRLQPDKQCYSAFFDRVASSLQVGSLSINTEPSSLIPESSCSESLS